MRKKWTLAAAAVGACAALAVPAGLASADDGTHRRPSAGCRTRATRSTSTESATAPMSECVVTNVRNPKQVHAVGALHRPGRGNNGDDRALVLDVVSQSISVTLDCNRH